MEVQVVPSNVCVNALIGLTTLGYFMLPEYFRYWMAAVGGGGLIVGGLWMRNAGS